MMGTREFWWATFKDGAAQVVEITRDDGVPAWCYFTGTDNFLTPSEMGDLNLISRIRTPAEVEALSDAMWQLLDDMGVERTGVCQASKAKARVAYEPFRIDAEGEEAPLDYTLEAAQAVVSDLEWQRARMAGRGLA